jgi:molecular chaperone GrpE
MVARLLALLALLAGASCFTPLLQPPCRRGCVSEAHAVVARRAFAPLMATDGADDDAPPPEPAADAEAPAEAAAPEEEEEEDDLLSTPAFLKQKLKVLEKELAEVQEATVAMQAEAATEGTEWEAKRGRLQADFDNFKARHANQTIEAQLEARIKVLNDFLPVLDNFDRARASISTADDDEAVTNGAYEAMHASLMEALGGLGMAKIDTVGVEFDYNLHNAIQQVPSDEFDEGVVSAELQPGYTCDEKLVRPAYVMVSAGM